MNGSRCADYVTLHRDGYPVTPENQFTISWRTAVSWQLLQGATVTEVWSHVAGYDHEHICFDLLVECVPNVVWEDLRPSNVTWRELRREIEDSCSTESLADNIIRHLMDDYGSWKWDDKAPIGAVGATRLL